jgi:hypothetical protein
MQDTSQPALSIHKHSLQSNHIPCPCCGKGREAAATECLACGARQIGAPLASPEILMPKLGLPMAAFGLVCLVVIGFLAFWLFGSNMKVGRVLLVWAMGDSFTFTEDLLRNDPKLPYYRIFAWDAWRYAFFLSAGIIPLLLVALRLAQRAVKLAKQRPAEFGGLKLARVSFVLAALLFVSFSAAGLSGIPAAIQRGRARHAAATRAMMYEQAQAYQQYYREYGTYPREASDLARVKLKAVSLNDYWENQFQYTPFGTVARSNASGAFSNYTLTSAGPDGEFGTSDDIVMVDGMIVDKTSDAELPASLLVPEKKPRK